MQQQSIDSIFDIVDDRDYQVFQVKKNIKNLLILDQGLYHVAICRSNISKIDGNQGKLYYRSLPIEEIVKGNDFIDVAFYLIFGSTGNNHLSKNKFHDNVNSHFKLSQELKLILDAIPLNIHPMDFLSIGVTSLSSIEEQYITTPNNIVNQMQFIIAQVAVIATYYYKTRLSSFLTLPYKPNILVH